MCDPRSTQKVKYITCFCKNRFFISKIYFSKTIPFENDLNYQNPFQEFRNKTQ